MAIIPQEYLDRQKGKARVRHRIAMKLLAKPGLVKEYARIQAGVIERSAPVFRWVHKEWLEILEELPPHRIAAILDDTTEREEHLRRSHPFPGLVDTEARKRLKRLVHKPNMELDIESLKLALEESRRVSGETEFVIVGTGAIVPVVDPRITPDLRITLDIDLWALHNEMLPNREEFDDSLGEGGAFHQDHGFYVERVGSWTMMDQPEGWLERAGLFEHQGIKARHISLADLAINKLHVGREKDLAFVSKLLNLGVVSKDEILNVLRHGSSCVRERVEEAINGIAPSATF